MIGTCIYINIGLFERLTKAGKMARTSKQVIAHQLFCRVLKEKRLSKPKIYTRIRYQQVDPDKQWKNAGIKLQPDMYEKCLDMKKVLKMSVSFIFAYAIRTYLDQVIHDCLSQSVTQSKDPDNSLPFYSIQSIFKTEVEGFLIKWTKSPG